MDQFVQLLDTEESTRLGIQGPGSVKSHPWFNGVDWEGIRNRSFPVPSEITSRVTQYLEIHTEEITGSQGSPSHGVEELNIPEWLEEW